MSAMDSTIHDTAVLGQKLSRTTPKGWTISGIRTSGATPGFPKACAGTGCGTGATPPNTVLSLTKATWLHQSPNPLSTPHITSACAKYGLRYTSASGGRPRSGPTDDTPPPVIVFQK
jgi:hypothetical protein